MDLLMYKDKKVLRLLLELLLYSLLGSILASVFTVVFKMPVFNTSPQSWIFKIQLVISQVCIFILPAVLFISRNKLNLKSYLGLNINVKSDIYLLTVLLLICIYPLIDWTTLVNSKINLPASFEWLNEIEKSVEEGMNKFLFTTSYTTLVINILIIALLPAIAEELFFRGCIQRVLTDKMQSNHVAVILTAVIFSLAHMQLSGFIPRFILGLILGYLYLFTGNIKVSMLFHFVNNAAAVIIAFMYFNIKGRQPIDMTETVEYANIYFALASFILTIFILIIIKRKSIYSIEKAITDNNNNTL